MKMMCRTSWQGVCLLAGWLLAGPRLTAEDVWLLIDAPPHVQLVTARVDLSPVLKWSGRSVITATGVRATSEAGDAIPLQFVPDPDFDGTSRARGMLVLRPHGAGPQRLRVTFEAAEDANQTWDGSIQGPGYSVLHTAGRAGGMPSRIVFSEGGKVVETMHWNNRLYHQDLGGFLLTEDPEASVELVSDGPLCRVVRVRGHYMRSGQRPASEPSAVYDWFYFRDQPLVWVAATIRQARPFTWHEVHFLEMDYPVELFPEWAGGEPQERGTFQNTRKTHGCTPWGLVHDGRRGIGMFACGQVLFCDAGAGTYLQAQADAAWQAWGELEQRTSAWVWVGSAEDPAAAVREAALAGPYEARVTVTVGAVHDRIAEVARRLSARDDAPDAAWPLMAAEQLERQGRFQEALAALDGQVPPNWRTLTAGDLMLVLEQGAEGIHPVLLTDTRNRQPLLAEQPLPLFALVLRSAADGSQLQLTADRGWGSVEIVPVNGSDPAQGLELRWAQPLDARLGDLRVVARAIPDGDRQAISWQLSAQGQADPWSIWRVTFPQANVPDLGAQGCVLFPKGCGEVQRGVWSRFFRFSGTYPSGWTTMQFMAAYREEVPTGLYLAVHDPWGSTKDLLCESRAPTRTVVLRYEHPAADMGRPGNRFELSGAAVWQLLRGDWFDASVGYREWVRREAKWYPEMTADGRPDTPTWMRELSAWVQTGGPPSAVVEPVLQFAKFVDPPAAVHWYRWHQIPFDNDYPHYFPTVDGFADGVRQLQAAGVPVMPYINGRLWDTRDRGIDDFEFSSVALPAVSKNEKGEPYTETYASRESDDSPVRLGVMCPSTPLWQARVREIVLRLMNECGVQGVYIDQVAAAAPTLCCDASHGHPLGGGHWWTEGYWKMLHDIRRAMPAGRMLTTECNGEPFIHCFDGYLTWHWQYDGQVPAFSAVYGGAIQMFGRSFGRGDTRHLALRMKVGQQLVFGEQIGWFGPGLALEPENADFVRDAIYLRRHLARYFYAGEMARRPRLDGVIPSVRADWQWHGSTWVTTDAVLTSAWHLPAEQRLVLVAANVSDQPVTARLNYDARPYTRGAAAVSLTQINPEQAAAPEPTDPQIDRSVTFPARHVIAWELRY